MLAGFRTPEPFHRPMDTSEKAALKKHFQASREKLSQQLPLLKESAKPVAPDNALGRLTRMDAMQSQQIGKNAMQKVTAQITSIDHALGRMDQPDFGLCAECGTSIPLGRLQAMPGARHCVNCV